MLVVLKTLSESIPRTYLGAGPTGPATFLCRNPSLNSSSSKRVMEESGSRRTKYGGLLLNPDLRRWYDNVRRLLRIIADVYLRRLCCLFGSRGLTHAELVMQARSDER